MSLRVRLLSLAAAALVGAGVGGAYVGLGAADSHAPSVRLLVPSGTVLISDDVLTIGAGPLGTALLDGACGGETEDYAVRAAAAPAGRYLGVIALTEVAEGTRLRDLTQSGSCVAGGIAYDVYVGNAG